MITLLRTGSRGRAGHVREARGAVLACCRQAATHARGTRDSHFQSCTDRQRTEVRHGVPGDELDFLARPVRDAASRRPSPDFCGTAHAVTCSNGTTALHLALLALGVEPGDEVIVPTLTYVATANAVVYCGATPVFVDSEPVTWNMDPAAIEALIGPQDAGHHRRAPVRPPGRHGPDPGDRQTPTVCSSSRMPPKRRAPSTRAVVSARSATPRRSASSATRSSPPARAAW